MTEIRSATSADAGALAELRWEFRTENRVATETHAAFVKRCAVWMRGELATSRGWRAWVAVADGVIVGQVWMHAIHKVPNPVAESERHAYLSNLYVKPSSRGGTGTRLLEADGLGAVARRRPHRAVAVAAQRHPLPAPRVLPWR